MFLEITVLVNISEQRKLESFDSIEEDFTGGYYRLVPAQDVLFALILWYVAKYIFRS